MTVSPSLPAGCVYQNPVLPFRWEGPTGTLASTDDNVFTEVNPAAGDYTVEIAVIQDPSPGASTCPCIGNWTSNIITVQPEPSAPNTINTIVHCGGVASLTASTPGGLTGGSFNWYSSAGDLLATGLNFETPPLTASTDYLITQVQNGCESSSSVASVVVDPLPLAGLSQDTVYVYCEDFLTLNAVPAGGAEIRWFSDPTGSNLMQIGNSLTITGLDDNVIETVYVANSTTSCLGPLRPVTIIVRDVPEPMVTDQVICVGDEARLEAELSITPPDAATYEFQWRDLFGNIVNTGHFFEPGAAVTSSPGSYTFEVRTIIGGCASDPELQSVDVQTPPVLSMVTDLAVCEGDSFSISIAGTPLSGVVYEWTGPGGATWSGPTISISDANKGEHEGTYQVSAENAAGCTAVASVFVRVELAPNVGLLPSYRVSDGETVQLTVSGADAYSWSPVEYLDDPSIPSPTVTPPPLGALSPDSIEIVVEATDQEFQCRAIESTWILIEPGGEPENLVKVYDVITPNGDGRNDEWYIDYLYNFSEYEIYVYNQQNQLVYDHRSADGPYDDRRWNGQLFNDAGEYPLPTGVYRYVIVAPNELQTPLKGAITLLR